jgi:nucleoside-diphosphate-sugar epimerase
MLRHLNSAPALPPRIVVVGARGFVGSALTRGLLRRQAATLALGRSDVDLLAPDAAEALAALLRPDDALVAVAARAPCKNVRMLAENAKITAAILEALTKMPVAHVVNISSDAVYGDSSKPLTEDATLAPDTLHGIMHLSREIAFRSEMMLPFITVRPSLLYGAGDPHNGYGPNRFRRLANKGEEIVLFGRGEERRDHVYIDDLAELIIRILEWRSVGSLNVATGAVHSFRDVADLVVASIEHSIVIKEIPRGGPMPHNGFRPFDIAVCRAAFPDFAYTPLAVGVSKAQDEEFGSADGRA